MSKITTRVLLRATEESEPEKKQCEHRNRIGEAFTVPLPYTGLLVMKSGCFLKAVDDELLTCLKPPALNILLIV